MKRTQLQLEEDVYGNLRERAFREQTSIAAIIRTILRDQTRPGMVCRVPKKTLKQFSFIGAGAFRGKGAKNVSERHDDELTSAYDIC